MVMKGEEENNPSLKMIYKEVVNLKDTVVELKESVAGNNRDIGWLKELYGKLSDRLWYLIAGLIASAVCEILAFTIIEKIFGG